MNEKIDVHCMTFYQKVIMNYDPISLVWRLRGKTQKKLSLNQQVLVDQ